MQLTYYEMSVMANSNCNPLMQKCQHVSAYSLLWTSSENCF